EVQMLTLRSLIVMAVFVLAMPTLILAQDIASEDFSGSVGLEGTTDDMDLTIVAVGVPNIKTNATSAANIDLHPGETADVVAAKAWRGLCFAAAARVAAGEIMCTGDTSCPLPGVLDVNIKCVGTITGNGFSLTRLGTDVDVRV